MSSSRRTGGEINILAMLDGKTPGMLSRRLLGLPRAVWYSVAAIFVCLLVASLTWLVRTAVSTPADSDEAALQPTPIAPLPTVLEAPTSAPVGTNVASGATIIDGMSATTPTAHTAPSALPPVPTPALPVSTPSVLPHDTAPAAALHRPPVESAAAVSAHAPSTKHPPIHATVRATTSERKPATPHANAGRADAPSRTKRQASAAKPIPPATLDTDVALISAIIQHTNAHPDPADAEPDRTPLCTKPNCHTRLPNRQ